MPVYQTEAIKSLKAPPPPPSGAPITAQVCKTKHQLQKWSPLNAYKHIKHGCLHCPSMTAFTGGVGNERLGVQRDNATSRAIITQVCGWDEGSKAASATGMPLLCCRPCCQKITGFISGRIKWGLRINEFLNTQHHLHKKQQAGYVGGLFCISAWVLSQRETLGVKRSEETKQSKSTFQTGIHKSLQRCDGTDKVWRRDVFCFCFFLVCLLFFSGAWKPESVDSHLKSCHYYGDRTQDFSECSR